MSIDVPLQRHTVVVGENRSGKSNLLHAVRLVLDSTLSAEQRRLKPEDFWEGLSTDAEDAMSAGAMVEVSLDITDFGDESGVLTALGDALIIGEPLTARLTYRWEPDPLVIDEVVYRARLYGGSEERVISAVEVRDRLITVFMHALRDVENDVRSWRRSPLRDLLESASRDVSPSDLESVRDAMAAANTALNDLGPLVTLSQNIGTSTTDAVGANQGLETTLAAAPPDPRRLIRSMQLFVDGIAQRQLTSTSLGALNVLYFSLLELQLKQRLATKEAAHVLMAVEEPEAHLHPHLQRLLFKHLQKDDSTRSTIVTTHSPHIASVTSARNLVMLRTTPEGTVARAASTADLAFEEWEDIDRYLDATRSELVFARRVLLVEGVAEQLIVPSLARFSGVDLDEVGISVCAIGGTHFAAYVKLCTALDIPWAVLTDGDPTIKVTGDRRKEILVEQAGADEGAIFVGGTTFEHDLIAHSVENRQAIISVIADLLGTEAETDRATVAGWEAGSPSKDEFISMIKTVGGKGRFAQRLAATNLAPSAQVAAAIAYLLEQ